MAILTDYLTNIANAIRNKKGTTDTINAQNFASEIESIEGGGGGATLNCGWEQGTPVPADATTTIQNIYLNTQLTQYDFGSETFSVVFCYTSKAAVICEFDAETNETIILKVNLSANEETILYVYIDGVAEIEQYGFSGWSPDFNGVIEVNDTNIADIIDYGLIEAEANLKYSYIASTENNFIKITTELSGEYTSKTINKTINVVENGTTTLSYASDFDTNKEILNKVDIVFNVAMPNIAQTLIDTRGLYYLFYNAQSLTNNDLEVFFNGTDTSNATNASSMFYNCESLTAIPLFDTSNVTDMGSMFDDCSILMRIPQINTSKVTNMYRMFGSCYNLTTIPLLDTSKVTNMSYMFHFCQKLADIPQLNTSNVTDMSYMFHFCPKLADIPQLNTSKVTNMSNMFCDCSELTTIPLLNTSKVTDMSSMFYNCSNLTTIPLLDTSNVINMSRIFDNCPKLTSIPQLVTSNVTDMSYMFYGCDALTSIPQIDTSKVVNISFMFDNCDNLTTVPTLDTSSATNMSYMFRKCQKLTTIDITQFKPSTIGDCDFFAYNCYSLTKLIIREMDTIPFFGMNMFYNCYHFTGTQNDTYNPDGLKDGRIYVPDNKVASLKAKTGWEDFADIIVPLSTLVE